MLLLAGVAALLFAASSNAAGAARSLFGGEKVACSKLKSRYPDNTFLPGTSGYVYETQEPYWSATVYSSPACVFVPQNAQQVAYAVTTMTLTLAKFAMRGGGNMPIPGYNGIDSSGVLMSSSNLTTLSLSSDNSVVSVGSGNRWRDVYAYLKPSGLAAVGGRVGHVGVPGLLLGGGISFYSSEYGFASDNVLKYQCVLSSGLIVEATATNQYSDLFWALRGGGNSFCIVTRFDLRPVEGSEVHVGIGQFDQSQAVGYLDGVYNFGKYGGSDPKAAIIPTILTFPAANLTVYAAAKFYNSLTDNAEVFENFTPPKLVPVADSYTLQPLSDYISATDALQPLGLRQEFRTLSSVVDREAVQLIHDTFISNVNAELPSVANLQASITFQPVTAAFLLHSAATGGNPQGVDVSRAPYFWMVENFTWSSANDDAKVRAAADVITAKINGLLRAKVFSAKYLYMNDAGKGQPIFQSYPAANLRRLKAIRTKYDPLGVYTKLMPGGWKVADA
ncbi:FAD-binding domain-containing protein [Bimuria novae-zelandiae CBS 107.79]|uniref:FAD-binding domain-containing protein n=1 Tax=Bimuria novae-zelandiae CBS 107.79 TaxID=1447943 RepID=A0A6A5VA60_9PLEO|nr:FAD-binding domain-containing protein [Bimuria novae-zelandiae CBS 107.79]